MTDKIIRQKSIKIKVTEDEFLKLNSLKTEKQLAPWMRKICLSEKVNSRTPPPKTDPQLLFEVAKIGNNINQIARQINTLIKSEQRLDAVKILLELNHINEFITSLTNDQ
jgi:hypothetical protein